MKETPVPNFVDESFWDIYRNSVLTSKQASEDLKSLWVIAESWFTQESPGFKGMLRRNIEHFLKKAI